MRAEEAKDFTVGDFRRHVAALQPETRMLIDGELLDSSSGKHFETINPANGEVIAALPLGTDDDVNRAVASARRAFKSGVWLRLEPRARMDVPRH